jgi:LexA-binding, inner membrane-associated putative hydrolase
MIFAGTIADVDWLSTLFGPAAYFTCRRTFTHSVIGTIAVIVLSVFLVRCLGKKQQRESLSGVLLPLAIAALLHVVLDCLQSESVALFSPFTSKRYAADCLPTVDLWIIVLLLAGILIPELLRLVTSEIGVKDERPRGRNGALVALVLIAAYVGLRLLLHAGSLASLDPHSYKGESARRVGAFPDTLSPFRWHGVVETQSFLCQAVVPIGFGKSFDPESAVCLHKPEASPELDAAQKTDVAREYLRVMPFPHAIVARTQDGYEIVVLSMRDVAEQETSHRLAARIDLDSRFGVYSEEFVWLKEVRAR